MGWDENVRKGMQTVMAENPTRNQEMSRNPTEQQLTCQMMSVVLKKNSKSQDELKFAVPDKG